jgi:hypothetical protein
LPALPKLRLGLTLVRNGTYPRLFPLQTGLERGVVHRKKCPSCKTQFSLLPNDIAPLHSYGLPLICSRLAATLDGQPHASRHFYEQHQPVPDASIDEDLRGQSWSDRMSENPPCPSPQLFRRWSLKWPSRAQEWLDSLLLGCLNSGCDLKGKLAQRLAGFLLCPEAMRALPLAAGMVCLLLPEEADWFQAAVRLLAFSPSHKNFRAAGRPPPHYGGALKLTVGA